jgi:L-alanine-DL-glutamate epimerase-like enolase superfamily enzyme
VNADGAQGVGWSYGSPAASAVISGKLAGLIEGEDVTEVPRLHLSMVKAVRNMGRPGIAGCAISAVDIALWDLKARLMGVSLASLFGPCREAVPIYGSGGFTTYDDETTRRQLHHWVADWQVNAVKIKIGESWGTNVERDLHRAQLAREVIGDGVDLFVDANGGYTRKQAVRVGRRLVEDCGVTWFEEPVSSDDLRGLRAVRRSVDLDVAAGEYGYDETYFSRMIGAGAVDCLQADVTRCGGYTSWLHAAAIAQGSGLDISGHCAPSLHAPVAISTPNLRHVEHFHDHHRLDHLLFDGALTPSEGSLHPDLSAPGHGMKLREKDADAYRVA